MADNLQTLLQFRNRYRVKRDSCGDLFIPCMHWEGEIFAWGEQTLAVHVRGVRKTQLVFNAIQRKCPSVQLQNNGDDELIVTAPLADSKLFFKAARALARRKYSEEALKALVDRGIKLQEAKQERQNTSNLPSSEAFGEGQDV